MESDRIRVVRPSDAPQIADIYRPIVTDTAISFETDPPSADDMAGDIMSTLETYPWLVYERDFRIAGYAYASALRTRPAYQWSVEVSVYTHPDALRSGVARALYSSLFEVLKGQGFLNAFAGIALPSSGSVALHEGLGFERLGTYQKVGHKLGHWHDVGWWQLELRSPPRRPELPTPFRLFRKSDECDGALSSNYLTK